MSGGHFGYDQFRIEEHADEVAKIAERDEWSPETRAHMRLGVFALRRAAIYLNRIDWLVCDDDGEETFDQRLTHELNENIQRGSPAE